MRNSSGSVEVTPRESADRKMRAERLFDTFSSEQYARDIRFHYIRFSAQKRRGKEETTGGSVQFGAQEADRHSVA